MLRSETGLHASNEATMYQVLDKAGAAAGIPISCMDEIYAALRTLDDNAFVEQIFRDGVMPAMAIRTSLHCTGYTYWRPQIKMRRDRWLELINNLGLEHEPVTQLLYDGGDMESNLQGIHLQKGHPSSPVPLDKGFVVRDPQVVNQALGSPELLDQSFALFLVSEIMWAKDLKRMLAQQGYYVVDTFFRFASNFQELGLRGYDEVVAGNGSGYWALYRPDTMGKPFVYGALDVGDKRSNPNDHAYSVPKGVLVLTQKFGT